ncbi:Actin cortical patch SUR7/pH-response regulator PalI, partial [Metarhizium brunneum ARSEF 3297]
MILAGTYLSILLFAAFLLLLLSVLSTPITKFVALGSFHDVKYGVFGYCLGDKCTNIAVGYPRGGALTDGTQTFDSPSSVRYTLSTALFIHPIAAILTLVVLCLTVSSHSHGASHSLKYLTILFILTSITFVACLASLIIDMLVFSTHLSWGTYIVLVATIILAISDFGSFIRLRTIIARKSHQQRTVHNENTSGRDYDNRDSEAKPAPVVVSHPMVPTIGGGGSRDEHPVFVTSHSRKKNDSPTGERAFPAQRSAGDKLEKAMHSNITDAGSAVATGKSTQPEARVHYGNTSNECGTSYEDCGREMKSYNLSLGREKPGRRGECGPPTRTFELQGPSPFPPQGLSDMRPGQNERKPSSGDRTLSGNPRLSQPALDRKSTGCRGDLVVDGNGVPRAEATPLGRQISDGLQAPEMNAIPPVPPAANIYELYGQFPNGDVEVVASVGWQQGPSMIASRRATFLSDENQYSIAKYVHHVVQLHVVVPSIR